MIQEVRVITKPGITDSKGEEVLSDFGRIEILVNNAGITKDGLMMRMTEQRRKIRNPLLYPTVRTKNRSH